MGSPRYRTRPTSGTLVTEAWFAPGAILQPHTHERTVFAVMLDGSFETVVSHKRLPCVSGTVWTEPAEERHANYVGSLGARVVVVQPDPHRPELFDPFRDLLRDVHHLRNPAIALEARRVAAELEVHDALSPLVVDALVVGMLAMATRVMRVERHHARIPPWLLRVRDAMHANVSRRIHLAELAAVAGVHPSHMAHAFRRHFHTTVGDYARKLRLNQALERLSNADDAISEIAITSGFSDQSHFTRECRRAFGMTPSEYRRRQRAS